MSVAVFIILRAIPGDPTSLSNRPGFTEEDRQLRLEALGLDTSIVAQYATWVKGVLGGDLGASYFSGVSSTELIRARVEASLQLALMSISLALLIAIPAALATATSPRGPMTRVMSMFSALGMAMPPFWLGVLLLILFSVRLGILPARGFVSMSENPIESLRTMVLPTVTLSVVLAAPIYRFLRASMSEVLAMDYITTAAGKGLSWSAIVRKHAFPNAMLPTLNYVGLVIGSLLGGMVAIEFVFGLPGLGALAVDAVSKRDYPVLQAVVLLAVSVFLLTSFVIDVVSFAIDPRLRKAGTD